jgi:hypothetical protein
MSLRIAIVGNGDLVTLGQVPTHRRTMPPLFR